MTLQINSHVTRRDNPIMIYFSTISTLSMKQCGTVHVRYLFQGTLAVWHEETPHLSFTGKGRGGRFAQITRAVCFLSLLSPFLLFFYISKAHLLHFTMEVFSQKTNKNKISVKDVAIKHLCTHV